LARAAVLPEHVVELRRLRSRVDRGIDQGQLALRLAGFAPEPRHIPILEIGQHDRRDHIVSGKGKAQGKAD
jgi:hypothetical protein